jgi:hypothetical protein
MGLPDNDIRVVRRTSDQPVRRICDSGRRPLHLSVLVEPIRDQVTRVGQRSDPVHDYGRSLGSRPDGHYSSSREFQGAD